MLIAFPVQGYGIYSVGFSILSIFTAYTFAVIYWRDINRSAVKSPATRFKAALLLI